MAIHTRSNPLATHWSATSADSFSNAKIRVFDSADGETWSAEKLLVSWDANDESCAPVYSNGAVCATATTEHSGPTGYFWVSTDNTVANMAKAAGSFNNIVYVTDMLYDQDSARWYVVGRNAGLTSGYVESSGDLGATWVLETSSTNNLRSIATDHTGRAVAIADDSGGMKYCTAGMDGTWGTGATGPGATANVHYLPTIDSFVMVGSSGSLYTIHNNLIASAPFDTDYDFDMCIFSDDVAIFEGDAGTRSVSGTFYSPVSSAGLKTSLNWSILPPVREAVAVDWDSGNASFSGGQGKLVYISGTDDLLTVLRYGATS